jgi:hypothetical protein
MTELGDYIGDLTDDVPDNRIIEFATGGPKNNRIWHGVLIVPNNCTSSNALELWYGLI